MLILKTLNREVKEINPNLELVKGEGYFYFVYDDGFIFETNSIYVHRLNRLSEAQWLGAAEDFLNNVRSN